MRRILIKQLVWIIPIFLIGCVKTVSVRTVPDRPPPPVMQYLNTADPQKANQLLIELMDYPVPELLDALTMPRNYPEAPTGFLPGQSIEIGGTSWEYGLYVPEDYDPRQAYPMIFCLHGAGFRGDTYLDRWQPRLGERYLLVCPSVPSGAWWTQEAEVFVLTLLNHMTRTYHVDLDRVFLSGMSNGAIGTYLIGLNHVDRFAALNPMAGPLPAPLLDLLDNARSTPLYIIHGAKDQVIPPKYSQEVWAYLLERGYKVQYREHDRTHPMAGGHFFPREELPRLIQWLAQQKRVPQPRKIVMVRDRDHPGRLHWIRMDEIDPRVGSFWASETDSTETLRLKEGAYARIEARAGSRNQIEITAKNVRRFTVFLNDDLVDLDRPVIIRINGEVRFEGEVEPDPGILLEEARRWPDPKNLATAAIEIQVSP